MYCIVPYKTNIFVARISNNSQIFSNQNGAAFRTKQTAMKNTFKTLACALALSTTVAFANPTEEKTAAKFEASAFITKDASIQVAVKKNVHERVYLTLSNAKGEVLFTETILKNDMSYAAKLNLSELADGAYKIEIVAGNDRVVKQLNVSTKTTDVARIVTVK